MPSRLGQRSCLELRLERLEPRQLLAANPIITEFLASNNDALLDGDGDSSDWIEIHNAGDAAADLAGYRLTDTNDELLKWVFPSVTLDAGDYMVVFASGKGVGDYADPGGHLHTNFRLSADGEHVALVSPEGTVVSAFGPGGSDYPQQVTDVSYGFAQATTLINTNSESRYSIPLDDSLGDTWNRRDFDADAAGFSVGTSALGYELRTGDRTNFVSEIKTELRDSAHAAFVRIPFAVGAASDVGAMKLRLKYDNGFIAYLNGTQVAEENAPANPGWFSTAPEGSRRDSAALDFTEFDLSEHVGQLADGENVLAIHAFNNFSDNSDMLLVAELIADQPISQSAVGYLPSPTPGGANFALNALTGPFVRDVSQPGGALNDDQDLVVTATVEPSNGPIGAVSLNYRVNYDAEVPVAMVDDGSGADATAGDGVFTGVIPHTASQPGDMLRWLVSSSDTAGNESRAPLFLDQEGTRQSAEYYGTVIADPSSTGDLPLFQWFSENARAGHTRNGTRASVFYEGEFYDNVFARQRGGATNAAVSQKFTFNREHELSVSNLPNRVQEINVNGQGGDASYVRQTLAHQAFTSAGNGSSESFLMHMQVNGEFDRVGVFIEQVDEQFLERNGFDPEGSLYKFVQRGNLGPVFSDTVTGIEKKTRVDEDLSDVAALVERLSLPTAEERKQFVFDNFNIPQLINYLAVRAVTLEADDVRKNFYLYRDTLGTGEWSIFPWDKDWTFGVEGDGGRHLRHPFFGDEDHAKQNANQWNVLYDVIFDEPSTREMYLRRLRTVMDEFLGPPGTPPEEGYYELRADEIFAAAQPLLPGGAANAFSTMKRTFFDRRRNDLFVDYNINNPEFAGAAAIPDVQAGNPPLEFGEIEIDPASGNQDEEYIQLINPNSTAVDISGWQLGGGIDYVFQPGTVIPTGGSIYVTPNVNVFRARTDGPRGGQGLFIQGGYDRHLALEGENLVLLDSAGNLLQRISIGGEPSEAEQSLRITEVNYHPHGPNPVSGLNEPDDGGPNAADRFEFVELTNVGNSTLDLSGISFTAGIEFAFAPGTSLDPGEIILVVKDRAAFESRYGSGLSIAGEFSGTLDDAGEAIFLDDVNVNEHGEPLDDEVRVVQSFSYSNTGAWPNRAGGLGSTLQVVDTEGRYGDAGNWRGSNEFGGSPGSLTSTTGPRVVISEILAHGGAPGGDMIELFNTTSDNVDIGSWYLSNSNEDYFQFQVPPAASLGARDYVAFDQSQFGFDLNHWRGDDVWLVAADKNGRPAWFADHAEFGTTDSGVSYGPWPDLQGSFTPLAEPTFGRANADRRAGDIVISEIHYAPDDPDGNGRLRARDFKYIELFNTTDNSIDLENWRLTGTVEMSFGPGTAIESGQTLLLVPFDPETRATANVFLFTHGLGNSVLLAGPFDGDLTGENERLGLERLDAPPAEDPTFQPIIVFDEVNFNGEAPWPTEANGSGASLTRVSPASIGDAPVSWTASAPSPGSAEFFSRQAGDANENGRFDQADVVLVLQGGKYLSGQTAGWSEGDWTGDGLFDQLDVVAALRTGAYLQGQQAASTRVSTIDSVRPTVEVIDAVMGEEA